MKSIIKRMASAASAASSGRLLFNRLFDKNKVFSVQLTHVFGFGFFQAKVICSRVGINPLAKVSEIPEFKIEQCQDFVKKNYVINRDFKRVYQMNIEKLIASGRYRGKRLELGLPAHGQRTHTNARTARKLNGRIL